MARPRAARRHAGLLIAGGALAVGITLGAFWRNLAPIHDITTDIEDPPRFVAIVPLRQGANSADYAGPGAAAWQRRSYPDVVPAYLPLAPRAAYERCLEAARAMGWDLVAAVPEEGRIEATATTRLLRFKDDVVVRISAAGPGSRVDVRSSSRVGVGDLGTNARRVRAFLERAGAGIAAPAQSR